MAQFVIRSLRSVVEALDPEEEGVATYTYDIEATPAAGFVRLMVGDTDVSGGASTAALSDQEISALLSQEESDKYRAAAAAARAIAASTAKVAVKQKGLETEIDRSKVPEYFLKLAEKLEAMSDSLAGGAHEYEVLQGYITDSGLDLSEYLGDPETLS